MWEKSRHGLPTHIQAQPMTVTFEKCALNAMRFRFQTCVPLPCRVTAKGNDGASAFSHECSNQHNVAKDEVYNAHTDMGVSSEHRPPSYPTCQILLSIFYRRHSKLNESTPSASSPVHLTMCTAVCLFGALSIISRQVSRWESLEH